MDALATYNPEIQPNAETWLELDEQERISLAERFHLRAKIDLPNVKAHAVFHAIIENQIALGVESVVRAIPRLIRRGLSRHDAVYAVASVLADHLYEQSNAETEDTAEVVQARYDSAVERLTALQPERGLSKRADRRDEPALFLQVEALAHKSGQLSTAQ